MKRDEIIKNIKRVVLKFGTNVLRDETGELSQKRIESFILQVSKLHKKGVEVIVVTSGAVGIGAKKLGVDSNSSLTLKMACASIGQGYLMSIYEKEFQKHDILVSQLLLTEDDFSNRIKYLNLSDVLNELLKLNVIPIINQNDAVSSSELETISDMVDISFSDNDKLSALVASRLEADLLIILSDIDGLYDDNPKINPNAKFISVVEKIDENIEKLGLGATSGGRGGMKTKLQAAKVMTRSGGACIISNGKIENAIDEVLENNKGTIFLPYENLSGKKKWIAYAVNICGQIVVNNGAKKALLNGDSSLLPIGVVKIENDFQRGDVVNIVDKEGNIFARGVANYNCSDCIKLVGCHSDDISEILGYKNYDAIITRDNIVIL